MYTSLGIVKKPLPVLVFLLFCIHRQIADFVTLFLSQQVNQSYLCTYTVAARRQQSGGG